MRTHAPMRIKSIAIWTAAWWLTAPGVLAQGGDKATAELLFSDGRRLLQEGQLEAACEKLAESHRLDPAAGTLLNLAECLERRGLTASAWATWLEAAGSARSAGQTEREALARQRAEALKPRLAMLTIQVPEANRLSGLAISRNGTSLGPVLWGTAAPVDSGTQRIVASAPGHETWSAEVLASDGAATSVLVPLLGRPAALAPPLAPAPGAHFGNRGAEAAPTLSASSRSGGPPIGSYIAGGVGVLGLAVGTVFGLQAIKKNDQSKDEDRCPFENECFDDGLKLREEAFDAAKLSTVGFLVGGVGIATAAVLWIASPGERDAAAGGAVVGIQRVTATAGPRAATLSVQGAF